MKGIFNFIFLAFAFSISIIPIEWNVKFLLAAVLFSFFTEDFFFRFNTLQAKTWSIFFYVTILSIGVCYSENLSVGLSVLETNFSFMAIAIIGGRYKEMSARVLYSVVGAFVAGVFFASALCFLVAILNYYKCGNTDVFFYYKFTQIIDSHPTYFAYYLILSITILLHELNTRRFGKKAIYLVLLIMFLFFVLMLTGGRTSFISLLLVSSFFLLKAILSENGRYRLKLGGLSLVMILGMFLMSIFQETAFGQNNSNDTTWERMHLWEAAINANQNYLFGVGTGDYRSVLNDYYSQHDLKNYAKENYNSHNQFIQIYFSNGLLGLVAVLLLIGRPLYLAVQHDHVLGILVFFPFLIYGMTEVFLGRYQGVALFALLHQLFVSYYLAQKPPVTVKR